MGYIMEDGFTYKVDYQKKEAFLTEADANQIPQHVKLPSEVDGCNLISIMQNAFANNQNLLSIFIPASIQYIGAKAFMNCTNLKSVYVDAEDDSPILNIYNSVFMNCKNLKDIKLRYPTTFKDWCIFEGCEKLHQINTDAIFESIPRRTFFGCKSLKRFSAATIEKIEEESFKGVDLDSFYEFCVIEDISEDFFKSLQNARISCPFESNLTQLAYEGYNVTCP